MIVAIIGAATALFAATIGLAQWDIKKVLAYSTISQLGYMFLACGVGAFAAGIFHVFTHAFFKALLFLGSGSVIVGMHHEQDMRRMGGLKKFMPITFLTMLVGWLAISGVPLLSGFFSKDEILFRTFTASGLPAPWPMVLWAIGALTALLTAVYMTRLMVLTFWGSLRSNQAGIDGARESSDHHGDESHQAVTPHGVGPDEHEQHSGPPRESPPSMVIPLVVLAIGAAFAGYLGVPEGLSGGRIPNYFEHLLAPSLAHPAGSHEAGGAAPSHATPPAQGLASAEQVSPAAHAEDHSTELILTGVSTLVALIGIAIGWVWFKRKPLWEPPRLLEEKYYVDEAYDAAVVQPVKVGSTSLLWKMIDVGLIDGAVNGAGNLASQLGNLLRRLQSGLARSYVAVVIFGALVLIGYFVIR
jgi:NADH-quinone oxidoreductase subunit L